ncbi:hypothetical protein B4073_4307 [Bacillus subtilis]|nr:hypothetical protein B4068_4197 [Bacillus subtilis]KIN48992.1 hypothetical protein B4073_4307 [Bacillus subtilis]
MLLSQHLTHEQIVLCVKFSIKESMLRKHAATFSIFKTVFPIKMLLRH